MEAIETGWLANSRFLVGDALSLADFAAYVEIGQLQPGFTNVFGFTPYPNVQRWLDEMRQVDGHDTVHEVLAKLGDISREAPAMDTIRDANKSALRALNAKLAEFA